MNLRCNVIKQFTEWKTHLEKTTNSSYVQHEVAKQTNRAKHQYFYCHWSGQSRKIKLTVAPEKRRRAVKSQGM